MCRDGGIPARNAAGDRLLLYIGIIDVLQCYRAKKQLEHTFKSMLHDGVGRRVSMIRKISQYLHSASLLYLILVFVSC